MQSFRPLPASRRSAPAFVAALIAVVPASSARSADGIIIVDPVRDRAEQRLNGTRKPPQWNGAPMVVTSPMVATDANSDPTPPASEASTTPQATTAATPLSLETSFTQWATFDATTRAERIESIRSKAPYAFAKPPVLIDDPALDVWFAVDASQPAAATTGDRFSRLGADYKFGRSAVFGFAVADKESEAGLQKAQSLASYFAWRPIQMVTLDGRLGIASAHMGPIDGPQEVMQRFATARVRTDWSLGSFKLSPALSLTRGIEVEASPSAIMHENSVLSIAPRLSRSFDLGGGQKLEPFVTIDRKLAIGNGEPAALGGETLSSSKSVGAGVTLKQQDAFSLDVTTSVEERDVDGQHNLKSGLKLKVPLN